MAVHKECNGTGEQQTVRPENGEVTSEQCKPCGGNGTTVPPQHGGAPVPPPR